MNLSSECWNQQFKRLNKTQVISVLLIYKIVTLSKNFLCLAYSYDPLDGPPQAQPLPQYKPKDLYPSMPQVAVEETRGNKINKITTIVKLRKKKSRKLL